MHVAMLYAAGIAGAALVLRFPVPILVLRACSSHSPSRALTSTPEGSGGVRLFWTALSATALQVGYVAGPASRPDRNFGASPGEDRV
jgi:hypothetical protein